jgi:AcrR family transcriptional regulator
LVKDAASRALGMATAQLPRRARTEQAILDATRELLAEGGVHHLTIEGVAARSGVAKTTIYRRCRCKDELALDVLLNMTEQIVEVPDLGDVRAELVSLVDGAVRFLGKTLMGRVMQGLASDLATDPRLGGPFREQVVALRVAQVRTVLDRAVERGEVRADVDAELVQELLFGAVYFRLLLSGNELDARLAERIVDAVLPGIRRP